MKIKVMFLLVLIFGFFAMALAGCNNQNQKIDAPSVKMAKVSPKTIKKLGEFGMNMAERLRLTMIILVPFTEGTKGDDMYRKVYGGSLFWNPRWKPLDHQTFSEVFKTQDKLLNEQRRWSRKRKRKGKKGLRFYSSAVGFSQMIKSTLKIHMKRCGLKETDIFSEENQKKLFFSLLREAGSEDYLSGKISRKKFFLKLAKMWASFPDPRTGKSYHGQPVKITVTKLNSVFDLAKLP